MFDSIQNSVTIDGMIEHMKGPKETALWAAVYGGVGFIIGFFFKQCGRYLVALLLFIGILVWLHHREMIYIEIDQEKVANLLGVQIMEGQEQVVTMLIEWIKAHVYLTIAFVIGFLLGIRVD